MRWSVTSGRKLIFRSVMAAALKTVESVLEIARWAPSGDNAPPWRFRIESDREIDVFVQRQNPNIYEYRNGEPTLISVGALLENIELAASAFGMKAEWVYVGSTNGIDRIRVNFHDDRDACVSPLFNQIKRRSVDRRPYRLRPLDAEQKNRLNEAAHPGMRVDWYDGLSERFRIAALSASATHIRLTIPETVPVHRRIVDWACAESEHGIPSAALGLDRLTLRLTRWSMGNWSRTRFMNMLGAPHIASLQMDWLPGIFTGSYFAIRVQRMSREPTENVIETLRAGQAIQRFWLKATEIGLVLQPCVAMLAFWSYAAAREEFTIARKAKIAAARLASEAEAIFGKSDDLLFLGRIGWPRSRSSSRSIRLPLRMLLED